MTVNIIIKRRKELGLTQADIARMLKISRKTYIHFERGLGKLNADQYWMLNTALGWVVTEPYDYEETKKLTRIIERLKSIIDYELPKAHERNKKLHGNSTDS